MHHIIILAGQARTSVNLPPYQHVSPLVAAFHTCTSRGRSVWHKVSDLCSRTVVPVYNALRTTLHDDVEGRVQLFVDLEVMSKRES